MERMCSLVFLMFIVNTYPQVAILDYGSRLEDELNLLTSIRREINFLT
jgi:hypothetical protein